ncbi:MAG: type II secretion system F family protein [Kiloniellales bacterium]
MIAELTDFASGLYASASYWLANNPSDAFFVVLFVAVFLAVLALAIMVSSRNPVARRLAGDTVSLGRGSGTPRLRYDTTEGFWNHLVSAVEKRVPLIDEANRSAVEKRLMQAGFMGPSTVRTYYGIRLFLTVGLPLGFLLFAPFFSRSMTTQAIMFTALGFSLAGLYLPALWVSHRISSRQRAIAEGFPDALDMLVVCVEAGLGIDAAFNRVGAEMTRAHPALATQFALVSLELRAGKSRADALRNMASRIGLDEINSFVTLLVQSDALGTSIAQTLRVHADEMRNKRTMRAEEKAHKLPVKLTIPLVLFILPCMITVVLLPGIIQIIRKVIPALTGG